jgi:hypothetical protein
VKMWPDRALIIGMVLAVGLLVLAGCTTVPSTNPGSLGSPVYDQGWNSYGPRSDGYGPGMPALRPVEGMWGWGGFDSHGGGHWGYNGNYGGYGRYGHGPGMMWR